MKSALSTIAFLFVFHMAACQEPPTKRSRVALGIGHMHVSNGLNDSGQREWTILPMWVLDYDYSMNNRWTIGIHNDLVTETFKVEGHDGSPEIERSRPFSSLLGIGFKPGSHAVYSMGFGWEFSHTGNFFMTRLGFEYAIEIPGEWELTPGLTYDRKWNAYDSFSIALGVGRKF